MIYILLEACLAGMILVLIVWWTMFSGRSKGELVDSGVKPKEEGSEPKQ